MANGELLLPTQEIGEKSPRYYGWRVVLAANLGIMVGFSVFAYTFGIFVKPLAHQFGWNREAISRGFAIAALSAAVCSPLAGRWLDRSGLRRLLLTCMALFSCALAGLGFLGSHIGQFYATCFVIGAVGNISQIGFAHAISSWFQEFRGRALGLVLAGDGIGLMIFPIIAQSTIDHSGWRGGYLLLGALTLLIGLPPAILYGRMRGGPVESQPLPEAKGSTWREGLLSYSFWIIVGVLFLSSMSINGAMTHQVPLLTDHGMAARSAALTISMLGGANVMGRVSTGWLLDRFPGPWVGFVLLLLASAGILLLPRAASLLAGGLAASLLGFGVGGMSNTTPYLLTRYFGLRSFSTLYGLTFTFYAVAGGTGPVLMGHVFDRTGSYTSTLTVFGGMTVLGAFLMLLLPRYSMRLASESA